MDISHTIVAKSDQLNADDLISGPITVQIERVTQGKKDQPVVIHISGGHQPWRPCKTMRRILVACWGTDARQWVGQWVRLYRDPVVKWAGEEVGGIRMDGATIPKPISIALQVSRGVKAPFTVQPIRPPASAPTLESLGITVEQIDAYMVSKGKPTWAEMDEKQRSRTLAWVAADPNRLQGSREPGEEG